MSVQTTPDFESLIECLRDDRGFDFTAYKRASLIRRVTQPINEVGIDCFRAYHDRGRRRGPGQDTARPADLWACGPGLERARRDEVIGKSFFDLDIGLPAEQLRALIRAGAGGTPDHDELVVTATTRKGRQIRCRVIAHALGNAMHRPASCW